MPEAIRFSLLGGPLHRLGCRLGLVRGTNTALLGVVIGLFLWLVMVALAFFGGVGESLFTVKLIGGHVRLLLVIPLMIACESVVDPRMTSFVSSLVRRGIVPESQVPALESTVVRAGRRRDSWIPEAVLLVLAVLMLFSGEWLNPGGNTARFIPGKAAAGGEWVAWWYGVVCLTVFRFLILRMLWRILAWSYFLWRVSRLNLQLQPAHPDFTGGLGGLSDVQLHFAPLMLGLSTLRSAQFAEEMSTGTMAFEGIYPGIVVLLLLDAILFLAPLLVFSPRLWMCRGKGQADYMTMAGRYVAEFDRKWVQSKTPADAMLGTPDLQSLADLANSVNIVRSMRWVPVSPRLLTAIVLAVVLPMLPLLLLKFPFAELAKKLVTSLVGL